jgi:hypothetical protein
MNDKMTKVVLAAWRDRFPTNAYAWPGAPESFAAEAVRVTLAAQPAAPVGEPVAWMTSSGAATTEKRMAEIWRDTYGHPIVPLYAAPPLCPQKVLEALKDCKTHYDAWRSAIAGKCEPFGSDDDRSYWDHELRVFDRTFAALSTNPGEQK